MRRACAQRCQIFGKSCCLLPDVIEALHMMEEGIIAACGFANKRAKVSLQALEEPGKLGKLVP